MVYFLVKTLISALLIAGVSELGKRSTGVAAILASLPLVSILAMIWLYRDTQDATKVAGLSNGIFWSILPSLLFFMVLPIFLKLGFGFWRALGFSAAIMVVGYGIYVWTLTQFGVRLG